jgi:hypothetical protein
LANQDKDAALKATFSKVSNDLKLNENRIVTELNESQGNVNNIAGYYLPNEDLANSAMRPNKTLNSILEAIYFLKFIKLNKGRYFKYRPFLISNNSNLFVLTFSYHFRVVFLL